MEKRNRHSDKSKNNNNIRLTGIPEVKVLINGIACMLKNIIPSPEIQEALNLQIKRTHILKIYSFIWISKDKLFRYSPHKKKIIKMGEN